MDLLCKLVGYLIMPKGITFDASNRVRRGRSSQFWKGLSEMFYSLHETLTFCSSFRVNSEKSQMKLVQERTRCMAMQTIMSLLDSICPSQS